MRMLSLTGPHLFVVVWGRSDPLKGAPRSDHYSCDIRRNLTHSGIELRPNRSFIKQQRLMNLQHPLNQRKIVETSKHQPVHCYEIPIHPLYQHFLKWNASYNECG